MPQKEKRKSDNKITVRKVGAWAILSSIFSSPIVVSAFNYKERLDKVEVKVTQLEESNTKMEKQIHDIHWFLIKRNRVKVPNDSDTD